MAHLEEIKKRVAKGEKLNRKATSNLIGVKYARQQSKEKYLEIAKESGFVLHEWSNEQRDEFFNTIILNYLDYVIRTISLLLRIKTTT